MATVAQSPRAHGRMLRPTPSDSSERGRKEFEDNYSFETCCSDLPYTVWNTCPLCVCGLLPICIVCFSAIFRLDYATNVTKLGAKLINQMGLSYTVYYTAGCWPNQHNSEADQHVINSSLQTYSKDMLKCSSQFEVAAGEFDAFTGSLLHVYNVTKIRASHLDFVKVTPDWKFVIFAGNLSVNESTNMWAVGAEQKYARKAAPLLSLDKIRALEEHCSTQAQMILQAPKTNVTAGASLGGFRHLQIISPKQHLPRGDNGRLNGFTVGGELEDTMPVQEEKLSWSPWYRGAFAFDCIVNNEQKHFIKFSRIATLDFQLQRQNFTKLQFESDQILGESGEEINEENTAKYTVSARLHLVKPALAMKADTTSRWTKALKNFHSHVCPRFVPSKGGTELLFVAEDLDWTASRQRAYYLPPRLLGVTPAPPVIPKQAAEFHDLAFHVHEGIAKATFVAAAYMLELEAPGMRQIGKNALPFAQVHGCPEFMPQLYLTSDSIQEALSSNLFGSSKEQQAEDLAEVKLVDTFIFESDPKSASVLGVAAQVLAVSLDPGTEAGDIRQRHVLYNVDQASGFTQDGQSRLRLSGCQPIRAAGRAGHSKLQFGMESMMKTLNMKTDQGSYTTWLACLTADQRVAIVESANRDQWINMSMPYPTWTGKPSREVWCSEQSPEACFEVWSNPNPNV